MSQPRPTEQTMAWLVVAVCSAPLLGAQQRLAHPPTDVSTVLWDGDARAQCHNPLGADNAQ